MPSRSGDRGQDEDSRRAGWRLGLMWHRRSKMRPQPSYGALWLCGELLCAVAALMFTMSGAEACPICFSGLVLTIGLQMDAADRAVLAVPIGDKGQFRIVEVIKGKDVVDETITEPVSKVDASALAGGKPLLLLGNDLAERWMSMGAIGVEYAGWLRRLAAGSHVGNASAKQAWPRGSFTASDMTEDEWRARLMVVAPYLEGPEPLAAEIAYGEMMRAPYSALRSIKPLIEAKAVASWIDDARLAARRSTYILLLGIAGGPDDLGRLEKRIDAEWASHDATNLSALLAADLELRGPSRLDWVEQMYFADSRRTLPEIEAALLALSVQGSSDAAVPRERVIEAYRFFMTAHKPMAGFVAQDLGDWGYWDAAPEYVALLQSDTLKDPASNLAVIGYLQRARRAVPPRHRPSR